MTDSIPSLAKGRRTVVMLDDDKPVGKIIGHWLTGWEGVDFAFTMIKNGDEALEYLMSNPPDIFITDVKHPGVGGWELLEKLAERKVAYPVIVFTGACDGDIDDRLRNLRMQGMKVNYWCKPLDVERMLYHLERVFRLPPQATPDTDGAKLTITPDQVLWMQDYLFSDGCSVLNHGVVLCGRLTAATFFTDSAMLENNWRNFREHLNRYRARYQELEDQLVEAYSEIRACASPVMLKRGRTEWAKFAPDRYALKLAEVPGAALADYFRRLAVWSGDVWETLDWLAHQLPEDVSMPPPDKLLALEVELKCKYQQLRERQIKLAKELEGYYGKPQFASNAKLYVRKSELLEIRKTFREHLFQLNNLETVVRGVLQVLTMKPSQPKGNDFWQYVQKTVPRAVAECDKLQAGCEVSGRKMRAYALYASFDPELKTTASRSLATDGDIIEVESDALLHFFWRLGALTEERKEVLEKIRASLPAKWEEIETEALKATSDESENKFKDVVEKTRAMGIEFNGLCGVTAGHLGF